MMLYAAPVWAEEVVASKAKKELNKLHNVQKIVGTKVISGYRTIARDVIFILARILPIEAQANILKKTYEKKKELRNLRLLSSMEIQNYQKLLTEEAINRWKIRLNKPSLPGRRIRTAIVPQLSGWFNRQHPGELNYRTIQLITGHGSFANFLYRIGKANTPICSYCKNSVDNAQHTLQECPEWDNERNILKNQMGENLEIRIVGC